MIKKEISNATTEYALSIVASIMVVCSFLKCAAFSV
jgi:hypothetical protein